MARIKRSTDLRRNVLELNWYGDEFLALIEEFADEGLFAAGEILLARAKARAPHRAGGLINSGYVATRKRSTYVKRARNYRKEFPVDREKNVMVAFAAFYGNFLEDSGAKPHRIPRLVSAKARGGRARKGVYIPGVGFRKSAQHPGFRRRPFLGPALEETQTTMVETLAAVLRGKAEERMGV